MLTITPGRDNGEVCFVIENISKLTLAATRKAWFEVGGDLLRTAKANSIKKPRGGRTYKIRSRSGKRSMRSHVASLPNESHANMFGDLRRSLSWKVDGYDLRWGYGVSTVQAPKYANWVEFGTRKMEERPTLRISMRENQRNTQNSLIQATLKELK